MYRISKEKNRLTVRFSASFSNIDTVCKDIGLFLGKQDLDEFSFDIRLGTREALNNAVRHGSKNVLSKTIVFQLHLEDTCIRIKVKDQGAGFDWKNVGKNDILSNSGKGITILKQYFQDVTFNEPGNELEFIKTIGNTPNHDKEESVSETIKEGEATVVKPDRNIVASMADEFKMELKEVIGQGVSDLTIDLTSVGMIDSMGLGVLIATHNSLQKQDVRLKLTNASEDVRKLLNNMRLNQHFEIL
ncbi:MAG: STAS domain-containing protein [Proteobacteria bacterium]|nr:STAS domain-containing protein [Pseudomonadota bacterium]